MIRASVIAQLIGVRFIRQPSGSRRSSRPHHAVTSDVQGDFVAVLTLSLVDPASLPAQRWSNNRTSEILQLRPGIAGNADIPACPVRARVSAPRTKGGCRSRKCHDDVFMLPQAPHRSALHGDRPRRLPSLCARIGPPLLNDRHSSSGCNAERGSPSPSTPPPGWFAPTKMIRRLNTAFAIIRAASNVRLPRCRYEHARLSNIMTSTMSAALSADIETRGWIAGRQLPPFDVRIHLTFNLKAIFRLDLAMFSGLAPRSGDTLHVPEC